MVIAGFVHHCEKFELCQKDFMNPQVDKIGDVNRPPSLRLGPVFINRFILLLGYGKSQIWCNKFCNSLINGKFCET